MTEPFCRFCLREGHQKDACPSLGVVYVRTDVAAQPNTEDDDAVAERMMLYRATKNALLGYAASKGFAFPASILAVDPDYTP